MPALLRNLHSVLLWQVDCGCAAMWTSIPVSPVGGAEGIRTPDPHNAIVVLYHLSYDPNCGRGLLYSTPAACQSVSDFERRGMVKHTIVPPEALDRIENVPPLSSIRRRMLERP